MIETKEQYDHLWHRIAQGSDRAAEDAFELIEALRKVARAGKKLSWPSGTHWAHCDAIHPECAFVTKLAALPDWITEDAG